MDSAYLKKMSTWTAFLLGLLSHFHSADNSPHDTGDKKTVQELLISFLLVIQLQATTLYERQQIGTARVTGTKGKTRMIV